MTRPAPGAGLRSFTFLGMNFCTGTFNDAARWLVQLARQPEQRRAVVIHVNMYNYFVLARNRRLARALNDQALILFDGIGMKLGALLLGKGWLPDLNGTDLFPRMMRLAERENLRVYFLGATEAVVNEAVARVASLYPGLRIVGHQCGYHLSGEEHEVVDRINRSGAQLLLVGLGCPLQEEFTLRNRHRLQVPVVWDVGGLFDFVSGHKPRAPRSMRRVRLEWLFRLAIEPRRMWFRYLVVPLWFFSRCLARRPVDLGGDGELRDLGR